MRSHLFSFPGFKGPWAGGWLEMSIRGLGSRREEMVFIVGSFAGLGPFPDCWLGPGWGSLGFGTPGSTLSKQRMSSSMSAIICSKSGCEVYFIGGAEKDGSNISVSENGWLLGLFEVNFTSCARLFVDISGS